MPVAMPDGTRRGRLWLWVAHRMAWVWLAMFAAVISQGVIASIAWGVVVDLAVWVALLALIVAEFAGDAPPVGSPDALADGHLRHLGCPSDPRAAVAHRERVGAHLPSAGRGFLAVRQSPAPDPVVSAVPLAGWWVTGGRSRTGAAVNPPDPVTTLSHGRRFKPGQP